MGPIIDGLKLVVMGMGYVFLFLVIMIFCMKLMGRLLAPIAGILDPAPAAPKKKAASADDGMRRAAAAIAVFHAHKNGK